MPLSPRAALVDTLAAAGHPLLELSAAGQGHLLVLPFGGRVLGLYADADDADNFLWVNPALAAADTARALLNGDAWAHTGGDRLWISPEIDTHIGDLANPWATYGPPRPVDPGHYVVTQHGGRLRLRNRAQVTFHRRRVDCMVELERDVRLIADPLRAEPESAGLAYAGYEQATTLRLPDPAGAPPLSLWSLAVVPPSGWMIVPTWGPTAARDFFEPTAPERLVSTPHAVHFRIDGQEQHKIGLRAEALTGRAGYLCTAAPDRHTLLVRQFGVNPSGDYIDTAWDAPDGPGYAFESYNGGPALGAFGELEYHTPAIGGDTGLDRLLDTSQLWAYSGAPAQIAAVARRLLGTASLPEGEA